MPSKDILPSTSNRAVAAALDGLARKGGMSNQVNITARELDALLEAAQRLREMGEEA